MSPPIENEHAVRGPRGGALRFAFSVALALAFVLPQLVAGDADAQRRRRRGGKKKPPVPTVKEKKPKPGAKNQVMDFGVMSIEAGMRTPQLMYFLDRASEELQRASLQRRSFVPEMVRSISEEGL